MKQIFLFIWAVLYVLFTSCAQETEKTELITKSEKMSYALGANIGASVKPAATEINYDALIQGVKDTLEGRTPLLTADENQKFLGELTTLLRTKSNEKSKQLGEKNVKEGEAFLAENKEKAGVTTTDSGLQYEVMKEGSGAKPQLPAPLVHAGALARICARARPLHRPAGLDAARARGVGAARPRDRTQPRRPGPLRTPSRFSRTKRPRRPS